MKVRWTDSGINLSNRTIRNRLHEMGFSDMNAKPKPTLRERQRRLRLKCAKDRLSWTVIDVWMKIVFSDKSRISIGSADRSGTFVWR